MKWINKADVCLKVECEASFKRGEEKHIYTAQSQKVGGVSTQQGAEEQTKVKGTSCDGQTPEPVSVVLWKTGKEHWLQTQGPEFKSSVHKYKIR